MNKWNGAAVAVKMIDSYNMNENQSELGDHLMLHPVWLQN